MATIPAIVMTVICVTFICVSSLGFGMGLTVSTYIGVGVGALALIVFLRTAKNPLADDPLFHSSARK